MIVRGSGWPVALGRRIGEALCFANVHRHSTAVAIEVDGGGRSRVVMRCPCGDEVRVDVPVRRVG